MLISSLFSLVVALFPAVPDQHPLIIAHRGASGELPEHTLAAYERAIDQGADYIEPDLVPTKDGHLIARHENEIGGTTDVAEKFPERKRTLQAGDYTVTGWFTEDFTLAEIKTLRAKERLPFRSQAHNGKYPIPTLEEIIELVQRKNKASGKRIGLYPETKHPSYFRAIGLPLEPPLLKILSDYDLNHKAAPVFIQSFDVGNLQMLRTQTELKLVQLIDETGFPEDQGPTGISYASMVTPEGLRQIRKYADGIGPYKRWIIPEHDGKLQPRTYLVDNAHSLGLVVHPWTFRSDAEYLHADYQGQTEAEYRAFFEAGVDGVFSDFTAHAVQARQSWQHKK